MSAFGYVRVVGLIALTAVAALSSYGQTIDSNKPLDSIYDKAKDETMVFISSMMTVAEDAGGEVYVVTDGQRRRLPANITQMVVYFRSPGKKKIAPHTVTIAFNAGSYQGFRFNEHRELSINLDNERLNLGKMQLTERRAGATQPIYAAKYWETLEGIVDLDLYRRIIGSKNVSMQLGESRLTLSEAQLKQLRQLADKHLK